MKTKILNCVIILTLLSLTYGQTPCPWNCGGTCAVVAGTCDGCNWQFTTMGPITSLLYNSGNFNCQPCGNHQYPTSLTTCATCPQANCRTDGWACTGSGANDCSRCYPTCATCYGPLRSQCLTCTASGEHL